MDQPWTWKARTVKTDEQLRCPAVDDQLQQIPVLLRTTPSSIGNVLEKANNIT